MSTTKKTQLSDATRHAVDAAFFAGYEEALAQVALILNVQPDSAFLVQARERGAIVRAQLLIKRARGK